MNQLDFLSEVLVFNVGCKQVHIQVLIGVLRVFDVWQIVVSAELQYLRVELNYSAFKWIPLKSPTTIPCN